MYEYIYQKCDDLEGRPKQLTPKSMTHVHYYLHKDRGYVLVVRYDRDEAPNPVQLPLSGSVHEASC